MIFSIVITRLGMTEQKCNVGDMILDGFSRFLTFNLGLLLRLNGRLEYVGSIQFNEAVGTYTKRSMDTHFVNFHPTYTCNLHACHVLQLSSLVNAQLLHLQIGGILWTNWIKTQACFNYACIHA